MTKLAAGVLSLFALLFGTGCLTKSAEQFQLLGKTMGTGYSVIVVAAPKNLQQEQLKTELDQELERISSLISTYDANSELSQFNAAESTDWVSISPEILKLVLASQRISKASGGAYDVTLSSISRLWGFGAEAQASAAGSDSEQPTLDEVLELMNEVGYQLLQVSDATGSMRKLAPGLKVDLSSIGKGYAVDRLGEILEAQGVERYLVDIGGEIRTRGRAADGNMWKIGIEAPQTGQQNAPSGVAVENAHVATSGNYRNYRIVNGERISHLLDGRTGYPIQHNLASVTLLHGSVALADAWATAFMAMGFEEALALAKKKGLAAQFAVREADGFKLYATPSFGAYAYLDK